MKERLDILIARKYKISRTQAARLIKEGQVSLQNKKIKAGYLIDEEEFSQVKVKLPKPRKLAVSPENIPLKVVYEDKDLLVVNKPAGMVVHPACGNHSGTLVNALLYHCQDLSGINGIQRPGIVHRLDKDTAGLLVIAKNDRTHQHLAKQFAKHTIVRKYLALVQGNLTSENGTIKGNLARNKKDRKKISVVSSGGKTAVTHYRVLKRYNSATLLEVSLETGRTHQIRVHFSYIGHPLVGDPVYNNTGKTKQTRQHLIAYKLGFIHPTLKKYMEFSAELPEWVD